MSTVKANNHQIGQSGTATNNFTLYQPSTPDGTVRLAVGNSGATTGDVLSVSNTGLSVTGTLSATGNVTLSGGTANGVLYLNGSNVATSGSALTFNGSRFTVQSSTPAATPTWNAVDTAVFSQTSNSIVQLHVGASGGTLGFGFSTASTRNAGLISFDTASPSFAFSLSGTEQMRLNSTGLGIGLGGSSPTAKLDVANASGRAARVGGLQISGTTSSADGGNNLLGSGIYWNGSNLTATQTTGAVLQLGNGVIQFQTLSGLTAGSTYSFAPQMTLDASGNLLVGATAVGTYGPNGLLISKANVAAGTSGKNLAVFTSNAQAADIGGSISLGGIYESGGTQYEFASIKGAKENSTNANAAGYLAFQTTSSANTPIERARITSGGDFFIGNGETAASPSAGILSATGGTGTNIAGANLTIRGGASTGTGAGGVIIFSTAAASGTSGTATNSASERVRIGSGGEVYFPGVGTTASAANAFLNNGSTPANQLLRSTSSLRYKTDVETLDHAKADAVLNLRPVWYRSKAEADRKDWSWYGLIAEEVAQVEPRLVHWSYPEDQFETIETQIDIEKTREVEVTPAVLDDEGNVVEPAVTETETYTETETKSERKLKADAQLAPDGVQYDRLTVMLLDIVKRQNQRIEQLEAKVAALEAQ